MSHDLTTFWVNSHKSGWRVEKRSMRGKRVFFTQRIKLSHLGRWDGLILINPVLSGFAKPSPTKAKWVNFGIKMGWPWDKPEQSRANGTISTRSSPPSPPSLIGMPSSKHPQQWAKTDKVITAIFLAALDILLPNFLYNHNSEYFVKDCSCYHGEHPHDIWCKSPSKSKKLGGHGRECCTL